MFFRTEIEWNEGKNVTKKVIKKKQKKGSGAGRFITKTVKADSFFNFFDPPTIKTKAETNEDDEVYVDCFLGIGVLILFFLKTVNIC